MSNSNRAPPPPHLNLNLNLGPSLDAQHITTPPRAARDAPGHGNDRYEDPYGYDADGRDDGENTPMHPSFGNQQSGLGYLGSGPEPQRSGRPSIDDPSHPYLATQPSLHSLRRTPSNNAQLPPGAAVPLSRTQTNDTTGSHHSRSPLNTPSMGNVAAFSGGNGNGGNGSGRVVKEMDYGTPQSGRSRAGTGGANTPNNGNNPLKISYPPTGNTGFSHQGHNQNQGGYTTIPLDNMNSSVREKSSAMASGGGAPGYETGGYDSAMDKEGAGGSVGERGRKKGIAWGGANRWSKGGTREEGDIADRPAHSRSSSRDLLNRFKPSHHPNGSVPSTRAGTPISASRPGSIFHGLQTGTSTPRVEWEGFEFNTATARKEELRFAEGDVGNSKLAKGYFYLLNKSIITRWFLYIFPVLVLLWIPGIVWLAGVRDAKIWTVNLLWWSIWFTVVWAGWWAALAASMMLPRILQNTVVTVVPSLRFWVDVIKQLVRNIAFIFWAMANWISFTPLIINHYTGYTTADSRSSLSTFVNLLFGLFLCTLVIGGEKLIVQLIAYRFHQESYEDRIREQKLQIRSLVTLYINSHDIPGRRDTLTENSFGSRDPRKAIKKALKGLKNAAQTTTTALGNVATEISGQSVLQTNSPYNRITAALASASKSKQLARRLYYSFKSDEHDYVVFKDIARYFPDEDAARVAFAVFDRDDNGDATRDEFEMACMQIHREKLAIEASLRDLDGAVRRLDDIFMVIVLLIIVLIMAAMVTNKLTTLVTSAGTFVLGLSWLIGTTMQEILGACIFLFVKHPFDVGDRVDIEDKQYVVASMQLMSTTLRRVDGTYTFIGNDQLRSKYIYNIRRSGPISETLAFEVDFATDFKKLVELRDKMLIFLNENRRDFMPVFDVVVDSFPDQGKLILKADIKYKTNWQEGALKVQRRNKWICALKNALADCRIYGPGDAGNPSPAPADPVAYTLVPYVAPAPAESSSAGHPESPPPDFLAATTGAEHGAALLDQRQVLNDDGGDIFDDQAEEDRTTATSTAHAANTPGVPYLRQRQARAQVPGENIEMAPSRARI